MKKREAADLLEATETRKRQKITDTHIFNRDFIDPIIRHAREYFDGNLLASDDIDSSAYQALVEKHLTNSIKGQGVPKKVLSQVYFPRTAPSLADSRKATYVVAIARQLLQQQTEAAIDHDDDTFLDDDG